MRHARNSALTAVSRLIRRSLPMLAGAALLTAAGLANAASLFDDDKAIEQAVGAMTEKIGGGHLRALKVSITPDEVELQVQDPKDPRHVDEWRFGPSKLSLFQRRSVSGPVPVQLSLINKDLEANLFDLGDIQFAASAMLIKAALGRAGLEDAAHVIRMEIERQVYILPKPSSGAVRWALDIASGRETARIFADPRGAIIGQDLSGTNRAKNLDMFKQPELAVDAARDFRAALGAEPILLKVTIRASGVGFETNLPEDPAAANARSTMHNDRSFSWNLSGLGRTLAGGVHLSGMPGMGQADPPFSVDEVDWAGLPKIAAAATEGLGMPQGRVTGLELRKNAERVGPPVLLWKVEVTDTNGEKGSILADTSGAVKQTLLPQSRRKTSDWFDPATMVDTFARIGQEFGAGAKLAEIMFSDDKVKIAAQDPRQPGQLTDVFLSDKGFNRFGGGMFAMAFGLNKSRPFTIADLAPLTAERIADLKAKTLARINLPKAQITAITIGRGNMDPSPKGNITVEIRALVPPFNAPMPPGGRIVYELNGTVIKAYLPRG